MAADDAAGGVMRRWPLRILIAFMLLAAAIGAGALMFLRGSLAVLDGEISGTGVGARVVVQRDALGIPTLMGADYADVAFALGFLHAQDRFFQMDLLRRSAAGELSALFGKVTLDVDRAHRLHRFRARAQAALAALPAYESNVLARYAAGVNRGLASLRTRPFEYGILRAGPEPWRAADSLLVVWAMYFQLQDYLEPREFARGWLKEHSTPEQLAFLLPESSSYDAPLDSDHVFAPPVALPVHPPDWFTASAGAEIADAALPVLAGSNNWALAGGRSAHGGAIVADDMHLGFSLPNTWYRAVLTYADEKHAAHTVAGVTLPGVPDVVVGSNGRVAWGFTNSSGDFLDLIELERDPANPLRYGTVDGWETATERVETIAVKGESAATLRVLETSLGPIREIDSRFYAIRWVAHEPGAVNVNFGGMATVETVAAAQAIANASGIPAQNLIAGDRDGHIGWTIAGALPRRDANAAATFPYRAGDGYAWKGLRSPADYPRILDPAAGQLWTANNRQLAGDAYRRIGDGGADLGARARQIRDDLSVLPARADEKALYAIGLDDRALFMAQWRERALAALDAAAVAHDPRRAEFRRVLAEGWNGRASADSAGFRLTRAYLGAMYRELFGAVDARMKKSLAAASYSLANQRWYVVAARLLDEKPRGWLPPGRDWQDVQLEAIDAAIEDLSKNGRPLAADAWGDANRADIAHVFAKLLPFLRRWLAAPADPLAGDQANMPRVAAPSFGQSERMVVSPGREAQGILTMPGGQSGHPLSPYFLAGHGAWVKGEAKPFLPGPTEHTLVLMP